MGAELKSSTKKKTCRFPFDKTIQMLLSTSTILGIETSKLVKKQVL